MSEAMNTKMKKLLFCALAFGIVAFGAHSAEATEAYTGVGNYDPAFIDQTNLIDMRQMEEKQKFVRDQKKTKEQEEMESEIDIETKKRLESEPVPEVTFELNSITIEKNTVYSTEQLMDLIKDNIGKEVAIADLIMMANRITDFYQNNGYLSTIAYVPPQKVLEGNVTIVVLEGKYGKVDIQGNKWARSRFLKTRFLDDNNITEDNILNVKDIKSALRDLNAQGYIKAGVSIEDSEYGEDYSELTLEVKDRFPIDFDFRWDNQGQRLTGFQRAVFYAGMYNLTGFGDQLLSTTTLSKKAFGQGITYSVPIGNNETNLNLGYTYSQSKPGGDFEELGIVGKSQNFYGGISRRLFKTDTYRLYGDIALDIRNSDTRSDIPGLAWQYKTRAVRLNLTNIKDDMYGKWLLNAGASFGVPIMDATNETNDVEYAGNNFIKLNANAARLQILPFNSIGILQVAGQATTRALFPSEKFSLGGIASIRGYEESFIIADNAATASLELRTPVPFLRMVLPEKLHFIDDSIRLAWFYDFGWYQNSGSTETGNYLMSIGGGSVIKLSKYVSGNFYLGIPIGNKPEGSSKARFHFTLTSNIL